MLTYIAFGVVMVLSFAMENSGQRFNMAMVSGLLLAWIIDTVIFIIRAI